MPSDDESAAPPPASDPWAEELYTELRHLARRVLGGDGHDQTLQATAVVHEAFLRMRAQRMRWENRDHFMGVAAHMMRRVLVDHARSLGTVRRGSGWQRVPLSGDLGEALIENPVDLFELDRALERLARVRPACARLVELRYFLGLSMQEISDQQGRSLRALGGDWAFARAWLHRELDDGGPPITR